MLPRSRSSFAGRLCCRRRSAAVVDAAAGQPSPVWIPEALPVCRETKRPTHQLAVGLRQVFAGGSSPSLSNRARDAASVVGSCLSRLRSGLSRYCEGGGVLRPSRKVSCENRVDFFGVLKIAWMATEFTDLCRRKAVRKASTRTPKKRTRFFGGTLRQGRNTPRGVTVPFAPGAAGRHAGRASGRRAAPCVSVGWLQGSVGQRRAGPLWCVLRNVRAALPWSCPVRPVVTACRWCRSCRASGRQGVRFLHPCRVSAWPMPSLAAWPMSLTRIRARTRALGIIITTSSCVCVLCVLWAFHSLKRNTNRRLSFLKSGRFCFLELHAVYHWPWLRCRRLLRITPWPRWTRLRLV